MDQLKKECYNSIDKFKLTYTGNVLPHENTFVEYPISFKPQFESNINMQHLLHLSPRNPDELTVRCMVGRIPFFVDIDAYASFQDLTKMIENLICNREKPLFIYFKLLALLFSLLKTFSSTILECLCVLMDDVMKVLLLSLARVLNLSE